MAEPQEIIIYIHGVSQDLRGRSHAEEYKKLHDGIGRHNPAWPSRYLGVEWGWNHTPGPTRDHELLTDAQRMLGGRVFPALAENVDWSINPGRLILNNLRPLLIYGFGDIFYYVSSDGKRAVRNAVSQQLCRYIDAESAGIRRFRSR